MPSDQRTGRPGATTHLIPSSTCLLIAALLPLGLAGEPAPILTIAVVGDVMLGRGVAQRLEGDWESAFAEIQPGLREADLAIGNLESPLTTAGRVGDGVDLRASPEAVAALSAGGFAMVSLANNHAMDGGRAGLAETIQVLDLAGITAVVDGGLASAPAGQLAFLAFDDSRTPLDTAAAAEAVAAAAERSGAVVVSIHWGGEYQAAPSRRQEAIAHLLAGAGADVIVGHGPHVLQRTEWIGSTLVAYSLGNFLFDQPYPADCHRGAILRVALRRGRVVAAEILPTSVKNGRVEPAGDGDAAAILARTALGPIPGTLTRLGGSAKPAPPGGIEP